MASVPISEMRKKGMAMPATCTHGYSGDR
jgi:hypothetical protein